MTDRSGRIDAAELSSAQLSPDGSRLILLMRDAAGRNVSLSLPADCLNTIRMAMPQRVETDATYALDSWSVVPAENGRDMILILCTPQGLAVSFAVKPWQVEGMATVAAHAHPRELPRRSVH
jgi:hypothetical protein